MEKRVLKTAYEVEKWFTPRKEVYSFDWETTGLNYLSMQPVGVSFCDGERICYIDLVDNANVEDIFNILSVVFQSGLFVAHNAKFDVKCCKRFIGLYPTTTFCTYIASYLLNENRESHSLKVLAVQDLHIPIGEIQGWEKAAEYGYTSKEWYTYCFNDAEWAYLLYRKYQEDLKSEGLEYVFYEIEMPFVFVAADMEINGILVDSEKLSSLEQRTKNTIIELEDRMAECAGLKIFIQQRMFDLGPERCMSRNLRSSVQLKATLKKLGFNVPNVSKETIEKLKGKHPFIDLLIDYKKVRKLYDAYILPAYDLIDSDGRIHPSFGIVKTGRTNCREPNLQQLPNVNKRFPNLDYRSIFVAPANGKLIGGDYSGQELRVLGEVSNDETIIRAFQENQDLHLVTANYIFNLGLNKDDLRLDAEQYSKTVCIFKAERYKAKNGVNFPIVYGSSEYGIVHSMGVTVEEAKAWQAKFFELYPKVKPAMNDTKKELENSNEVSTMMGRKRRFPLYPTLPHYSRGKSPSKSRCVRQAFNFKIQGFSADQIKIAAAKARAKGLKILMIIHDEIVCESYNPQQDARILKDCMEQAVSLTIPFVVDVKIGDAYNELK